MIVKLILGLFWLLSSGIGLTQCYEEEENPNAETINIINTTAQMNFIKILDDDHPYEVKIAIMKSDTPSRFSVALVKGGQVVMVELVDKEEIIDGKINYRLNPSFNQINFGGEVEINERFKFHGGGYVQANQNMTISHNQEYVLYKINIKDLTVEPILSQFVYLYSPLSAQGSINNPFQLSIQPMSAGVYLKKKIDKKSNFKFGVSAGPAINFSERPEKGVNNNFLGVVNLRFALNM